MSEILQNRANYFSGHRRYVVIFFVIFYLTGFIGLAVEITHQLFLDLFPLALILSFSAILLHHKVDYDIKTIVLLFIVALSGFIIEVVGVNKYIIFGNYFYGQTLGLRVIGVPLLIGINWVMLAYSGKTIADDMPIPNYLRIIVATLIMLLYDIILEQIAPVLNMWYWENNVVPVRNYIAWFLIGLIFQFLLTVAGVKTKNSIAGFIIMIQSVFFVALIIFFNALR